MCDFNQIYLFYLLVGISAAMFAEGIYLVVYNNASYRKNINRRLKVMDNKVDSEIVHVQLRRERGLPSGGDYRWPMVKLSNLHRHCGITYGLERLMVVNALDPVAQFVRDCA